MNIIKLQELPNIGKVTEVLLNEIGIHTPEELRKIGSREAFLWIRQKDPTACLRMLYGLEGAIEGISDNSLSMEIKMELKEFYHSL